MNSLRAKQRRLDRIANGLCPRCPNGTLVVGKKACAACLEKELGKSKNHRAYRNANGICLNCKLPVVPGGVRCQLHTEKCSARVRSHHKERLDAGLCIRCGSEKHVPGRQQCTTCYLKDVSRTLWNTRSRWRELLELFENQDGRCAYLGTPMVIGNGASIDHIIPSSRGGTDDISNLQWVELVVNRMKTDHLESEFLELIQAIVSHKCNSYSSKA